MADVVEIVARHKPWAQQPGKCVWCGCNWPCDARVLADELGVDADPTSVPIFALADPAAVDVARLVTLEAQATPGEWVVTEPGQCCNGACIVNIDGDGPIHDNGATYAELSFIAEFRNAAPSLLAAYRAVERVEALLDDRWSRSCSEVMIGAVRRALGGSDV
jgi:hypothetical protein